MSSEEDKGRGDRFVEAMRTRNPFSITSIGDTVEIVADVESIHAAKFRTLVDRALEAHHCNTAGRGGLLLGKPGVGKSHLIGRFKNWAAERKACFVYLHNVQVEPQEISRFLVKCCISKLADDRMTQVQNTALYQIVHAAVIKSAKDLGIKKVTRHNRDKVAAEIAGWLRGSNANWSGGHGDVFSVIFLAYCESRWALKAQADVMQRDQSERVVAAALRWLSGDVLDADDAELIGRRPQPGHESLTMNNQQAEDVIVILARLAQETGRPFILCVDQADMMSDPQLAALGHVLQSLVNRARNLFVLVAGLLDELDRRIRERAMEVAAADRLAIDEPIVLTRVAVDEAREIIAARIDCFFRSVHAIPPGLKKCRERDSLFPLGEKWFCRVTMEQKELRPRDVIQWSRAQWRTQVERMENLGLGAWLAAWEDDGPDPIDSKDLKDMIDKAVHGKLAELRNERLLDPSQLPADAGKLRALTLAALTRCKAAPPGTYTLRDVVGPKKASVDLQITEEFIDGQTRSTVNSAVQFVVTASKASTAVSLGKLAAADAFHERVLVTDAERRPLCVAASGKGAASLEALHHLGKGRFHDVRLTFAECAELDALEAVVGAANSGDLEIDMGVGKPARPITEAEVVERLYRNTGGYLDHPLLKIFLTQESGPRPPRRLPYPDPAIFKKFVRTKLTYSIGASLNEILKQFMKAHPPSPAAEVTEEDAFTAARDIVMRLHDEKLVIVKPHAADLFLLNVMKS